MALGVRAKLVLLSLAIVMAVSLGFTILHTRLAQGWVEDDLRDRAVAFAREIAATIGDRREFENTTSLQSQIRQILGVRPNVLQLDILAFRPDTTTVVATSHPTSRLPFRRQDADEVGRGRTLSRLIRRSGERAWEVMTPIVLDGDTVGADTASRPPTASTSSSHSSRPRSQAMAPVSVYSSPARSYASTGGTSVWKARRG
jgi:hypothetical protein